MIGAVIEKTVRRIAPDRGKAKLDAVISQLRELTEGLAVEDQFLVGTIALFQGHLERFNDAERAVAGALEAKDLAKVDAALGQPEVTPGFIQRQLAALIAARNYRTPYAVFLSQHQEAKTVLESVCELRQEQARIDAERVFTDEQARLGPEYDANDSPVVKRARGKASSLQTALNRIQNEAIENTFIPFASQLLSE
jgi:hypothetical protein